jgi:hypothetical protein
MHEFINTNRPEFVSMSEDGSQGVLIRDSATTYRRPAGGWSLPDGLRDGKHVVIKGIHWQLDSRVGTQLYPSTFAQFAKDNEGYVYRGERPWFPEDDLHKEKDDDEIPY